MQPQTQQTTQPRFRELVLEIGNRLYVSGADDCRLINMPFSYPENPIRLVCGDEERDWGGFSNIIDALRYLLPRTDEIVILLPTLQDELRFRRVRQPA